VSIYACKALWRHFLCNDIPSGSHDITSGHVTSHSCELKRFRSWKAPIMQTLPALQSQFLFDVTSGLQITSSHVMWQPVTRLTFPNVSKTRVFIPSEPCEVTSGHIMSLLVTWLVFPASYSICRSWKPPKRDYLGLSKSCGHFHCYDVTSRSCEVTCNHVTWLPVTLVAFGARKTL